MAESRDSFRPISDPQEERIYRELKLLSNKIDTLRETDREQQKELQEIRGQVLETREFRTDTTAQLRLVREDLGTLMRAGFDGARTDADTTSRLSTLEARVAKLATETGQAAGAAAGKAGASDVLRSWGLRWGLPGVLLWLALAGMQFWFEIKKIFD